MSQSSPARVLPLVLACFFASGLAALIYQTAWTRQLAFVFGTSELAVATVLAAYMGGLAAGAAVAARFAHRVRRPVLVYGLLELGIAIGALAVPAGIAVVRTLYVASFGGAGAPPGEGGLASAIFYLVGAFAVLFVPTALMGATLPLLTSHAVQSADQIGPRVGMLYAVNTLGAVAGTLLAGFFLLPNLGLSGTIAVAIACNALVFAIAALLARSLPAQAPAMPATSGIDPARVVPLTAAAWILPLIAISGAVSFTYEVLWTRLLSQLLGGSVYAFATMLATFLTGIALGSAFATRFATTPLRAARAFGVSQLIIGGLALAAYLALDWLPGLVVAIGREGNLRLLANAVAAASVLLPSTLAIGATFPLAVRVLARSETDAAEASARTYAWNTFGAIVGAIGAGFFAIPILGFADTLRLAVVMNLAIALVVALRFDRPRVALGGAASIGLLIIAILQPTPPWRLLRTPPLSLNPQSGRIVFYEVGRSATVLLRTDPSGWALTTNGLPESTISPPGAIPSLVLTQWLGSLPTLLRPETRSILVVGLGGGVVLESIPSPVEKIRCVELEPEVLRANEFIGRARREDPLRDPRVSMTINDARGALLLTDERFDAIVSQPSHPWTAGSAHLYSREFFELARDHLTEEGLLVQWMGLSFIDESLFRSILATLTAVFPHVEVYRPAYGGVIFVGSVSPLDADASVERAVALAGPEYARLGVRSRLDVAAARVLDAHGARVLAENAEIVTDDRNLLQMNSPAVVRARSASLKRKAFDANAMLAPHDPLDEREMSSDDRLYLVRRLIGMHARERAARLAGGAPDPATRWAGGGLIAIANGDYQRGVRLLQRALKTDRGIIEARVSLLRVQQQLQPQQLRNMPLALGRITELSAHEERVIAGWLFEVDGDFEALRAADLQLAAIPPEHPLFEDAVRLRVAWRLATQERRLAIEAVALIEQVVALTITLPDLLLHAQANSIAGRPRAVLASLNDISSNLNASARGGLVAADAIALLDALPAELIDSPSRRRIRVRLSEGAAQRSP